MGFAEIRRLQEYRLPGSQSGQYFLGLETFFKGSGNPAYPGGAFFNFANFGGKNPSEMKTLQTKEVQNGRLAMLAMLGFFVQASFTHASPVENLVAHLSDPSGANILTTFGNVAN
jgi:light-harvesting complex I chlorophyll a/b binding protein 3